MIEQSKKLHSYAQLIGHMYTKQAAVLSFVNGKTKLGRHHNNAVKFNY